MVCPSCGYALTAFDTECPRCKNLAAAPKPATPAAAPAPVMPTAAPPGAMSPPPGAVPPLLHAPPLHAPQQGTPAAPYAAPSPVFVPERKWTPAKILAVGLGAFVLFSLFCTIVLSILGNKISKTRIPEVFAQQTFERLAQGDTTVEDKIDFETLRSGPIDAGASYMAMPNETEKAAFRKSFITSFSTSFKSTGADASTLQNWRVQRSDASRTVTVADAPKGTVVVTLTNRTGENKLSGLDFTPSSGSPANP